MSVLESFATINRPLFLVCVCPFLVDQKSSRLITRFSHIFYIIINLIVFEAFLWLSVSSEIEKYNPDEHTLSGLFVYVTALFMVRSYSALAIFSLLNRYDQIRLLERIVESDDGIEKDAFALRISNEKLSRNFLMQYSSIVLYVCITLLISTIVFVDDLPRFLFIICYAMADITFTVYVFYVAYCGRLITKRYELFNKHFEAAMLATTLDEDIYIDLLRKYEGLFRLESRLQKAFGAIVLFTIFYHSVAIAISVYVIIIELNYVSDGTIFLYIVWTLPYIIRMTVLGHVFDVFGSQVFN